MKDLFQNIIEIKKAIGLSVHYVSQNEFQLSYCILSKKKGLLNIDEFGDLNDLLAFKELAENLPIFINITGKVIIEKILNSKENENYIRSAFPSNSNDEFLFQVYEQSNKTIVGLIRLDKTIDFIEELKSMQLSPISVSLGMAVSTFGYQNIDTHKKESLELLDKKIIFSENEILEIESSDTQAEQIIVERNRLSETQFLALSVGINAFFEASEQISIKDFLLEEKQDYNQRNIFDKLKIAIPLFFLALLLINFFFYSSYFNQNEKLSNSDITNNGVIESLDKLKTEMDNKETFLNKSNWLAQSKVSYYSDQIGLLIPNQISLSVLDVFPATLVKSNNTKSYTFENKVIKISGRSESLQGVNDWKQKLQTQKWIKDVELISYLQDDKAKDISFELKLILF